YLFDRVGNLIQRQNNALGLTENFCYDDLHRLVKSALGSDAYCNTGNNLTVVYEPNGNIQSRSDVASGATWTYHATRKHAVSQAGAGSLTYAYDENGNAISRHGNPIVWNSYDYPTSIGGTGESVALYYDGNHARWKQEYDKTGEPLETTIYAGGLLEKVAKGTLIDWRHYIQAGGKTIAVYSRQNGGTNTLRYTLEDHQGSVANITTDAGAPYVGESFTAFGNRRNPTTWSGAPTTGDVALINAVSRHGYTGHEFLGSLGLNHMNGRVQDAIIGRFLSADPFIADPSNTQSYNRYSYLNNNPMSFTDPTGFLPDPVLDPVIVTEPRPAPPPPPSGGPGPGSYGFAPTYGSPTSVYGGPLLNPNGFRPPVPPPASSIPTVLPPKAVAAVTTGNAVAEGGVESGKCPTCIIVDGVSYAVEEQIVSDMACGKFGDCTTRPVLRADCGANPGSRSSSCDALGDVALFETLATLGVGRAAISGGNVVRSGLRTAEEAGMSARDILRIQNAANRTHQDIIVIGSRARGVRYPNDWDYILTGPSRARGSAASSLPRGLSGGEMSASGNWTGIDIFQNYNPVARNFLERNPKLPHVIFTPR
ncbi:MAG TPA: RHS repeat-associated core domain-containing protein, partial [Steroidobacteraceae bacterium]|nr:RHS repeat-associated core domain-containing protein [Steroidobacteraceae bacterium]